MVILQNEVCLSIAATVYPEAILLKNQFYSCILLANYFGKSFSISHFLKILSLCADIWLIPNFLTVTHTYPNNTLQNYIPIHYNSSSNKNKLLHTSYMKDTYFCPSSQRLKMWSIDQYTKKFIFIERTILVKQNVILHCNVLGVNVMAH